VTRRRRIGRWPGERAWLRVGDWPGDRVGKPHGLAAGHAKEVWTAAMTGMVNRANALWESAEQEERAFHGEVDLAFLATVAAHLNRCEKCWEVWMDGERPVDLLTQAVRRIPAWEVFRPMLREARLAMGKGHH
jgi:hypothetical protein